MQQATLDKVVTMSERGHAAPTVDATLIRSEFERVQSRARGVTMLLLTTADGRAVAEWSHARLDPRRVGAMTNSFLTLGETLSREVGMSAADHATISTVHGSLVVIRIDGSRPYTLAVMGGTDASLAVLLFAARDCAARISTLL